MSLKKSVTDLIPQVMIISDTGKSTGICSIYELNSTHLISSFQGEEHSITKGLALISDDFLISAFIDKPCMKMWTISKNHKEERDILCPGKVTSLAVSKCGTYCVAGIENNVYLWEVASGKLLSTVSKHLQTVTCLRFTSDGSHFISGGKDGLVFVWFIPDAIQTPESSAIQPPEPRFQWLNHSAEVTDIHTGKMGIFSRVVTASLDSTCLIYELEYGNLLVKICVEIEITAITMTDTEYFLMLGSGGGNIYRINLFPVQEGTENLNIKSDSHRYIYNGHTKKITCLSLSEMGRYLLSGSEDGSCKLWDTNSLMCIKTLSFDGAVTNAFIALRPPALLFDNYLPRTTVSVFKRNASDEDSRVLTKIYPKNLTLTNAECLDNFIDPFILTSSSESLASLHKKVISQKELALINTQLYAYALSDTISQRPNVTSDSE